MKREIKILRNENGYLRQQVSCPPCSSPVWPSVTHLQGSQGVLLIAQNSPKLLHLMRWSQRNADKGTSKGSYSLVLHLVTLRYWFSEIDWKMSWSLCYSFDLQLEFPAKPKGELQKSNDEKFMKFLKTQGKGKHNDSWL